MEEELKILKALSDKTRLNIVRLLLEKERCVCEIFPKVKRTQSTVSIQLKVLEDAGIVESKREGQKVFYKLKDLRVCDIFKALGDNRGMILKKECCCK